MRRCIWFLVLGICLVITTQTNLYAADPPHSLGSSVHCGECHGNALFPAVEGMTPIQLQQAYNTMCKRCHVSNAGAYHGTTSPIVGPHDSNTVRNPNYTFQTGCTDCHHPHNQTQQIYWGYRTPGSPGQIFRGQATTIQYLDTDDQVVAKAVAAKTRVTYSEGSLTVLAGSVFDTTDGILPDGSTGETVNIEDGLNSLQYKMFGFEDPQKRKLGRGALFIPFYRSHYESRIIEAIDTAANTITFKGTIQPTYEQYMLNYGGFAISYGLAIHVSNPHPNADPSRPVYFFDRTGDYGFGKQDFCDNDPPQATPPCTDSTPNGICQACHTQTAYYKNDGTGNWHFNGGDCMECHSHLLGFAPTSTVDHTDDPIWLIRSPAECTDCHDPGGSTVYSTDIHNGNCDACHTESIPALRTDHHVTMGTGQNCTDCHENGVEMTYLTDFDNLSSGHQVQDHSGLTGNNAGTTVTTSCYTATYCHSYSSGADIAEVTHDACTDCHINTGSDGRLKDGANNYGDATGHVIYTTSSCDACHAADGYFDAHLHPVHDSVHRDGTDQSNNSDCEGCHYDTLPELNTWTDIYVLHQNSCILCHDATRDVNPGSPVGITVQDRIATGSGNKVSPTGCLHCHQDRSATHMPDHKVTGMVTGSTTNCVPCHDPTLQDNETQYLIGIHYTCGKCHEASSGAGPLWNYSATGDNTGGTIGDWVDYESIDANLDPTYRGGSCHDCHDSYANNFGSQHNVVTHDYISGDVATCTGCHAGNIVNSVHATPGCTDCHNNSTTDGRLANKTSGDATLHTMGSTSDCTTCHGASGGYNYDSDFGGAHAVVDHQTTGFVDAVASTATCTNNCHTGDTIVAVHKDNCLDCHNNTDSDGRMHAGDIAGSIADGTSYGTAANHVLDSTSSCADCHENGGTLTYLSNWDGGNGHQVQDHDGLTGTTNSTPVYDCNTCHAAATKSDIASVTHGACTDCHLSDGEMVGSQPLGTTTGHVLGATSNCADCHSSYAGDFETHIYSDTTDHAPGGSGATVYQLATDLSNGELCDNCHGSTLTDWSNVYDLHNVASNGAGSCATCHNSTRPGDTDETGVQDVIHSNGTTNSCLSCHQSASADHSDHVSAGWVLGDAECTGCHDETGAASHAQYVVVIHDNGGDSCSACHTNPGSNDYTLLAGSSAEGHETGPNTCNTCHTTYATDFTAHTQTNHSWVGSNVECSDCHTGDIMTGVHSDNCENCHTNTGTDGRLHAGDDSSSYGGATSYGSASYPTHSIGTTSACGDCHASHGASFTTGHQNEDHATLLSTPSTCTSCHDGAMITATNTHSDACTYCHVNTDTDGRLVDGATGTAAGNVGDATGHTWGSTSSCAGCHSSHDASFTTGHQNEDHADLVTSANCDGCHTGNMITGAMTHSNACAYCHVSTDTDGTLVNGATGTATGDVGDATVHTWGSTSSCNDCHEDGSSYTYASDFDNLTTGHLVQDHDGLTGTTNATLILDCNNCHAAATKVEIAETSHTTCDTCHNNTGTDGELVGAATTGTTQGHSIGTPSSCADCHGASGGYNYDSNFENHIYADSTTDHIAPPGSGTSVYQLAGTDEIGATKCDACHGSTLTDWDKVYDLHNVATNGAGACATCHNSTRSGDTDTTGIQDLIHANEATNPCISCHVSKASDHSDHVLTTWVIGNGECTGCHDQANLNNSYQMIEVIHSNNCGLCHNNPGGGDYSLIGSAANNRVPEDNPGGNTCNTCHDSDSSWDYAGFFGSAHQNVDHQTEGAVDVIASTATCTGNCHTGDTITAVHTDDCFACHVNTLTDGRLVDNAGAGNGTAIYTGGHTIDSTSNCVDCHEDGSNYTYQSSYAGANGHKVQDHDGLTGTTNSTDPEYDCNGCHSAATKTAIAETTHGLCTNCHTGNGDLVGAQTYGTTVGHAIGSTSNCVECHSARAGDFETHLHGTATNHKTGGSGTTILEDTTSSPNGDRSQESGALCSSCHVDYDDQQSATDVLQTWRSIVYEHDLDGTKDGDGACVTCHNSTRDVCKDGTRCTQSGTTIQDVIATGSDPTNCVDCHEAKVDSTSSNAAHGGHGASDFAWQAGTGSLGTCSGTLCHDSGAAVIQDIHNGRSATSQGNKCLNCHDNVNGGDLTAKSGDTEFGVDGDATLGSTGTPHTDICTDCHTGNSGTIHHDIADATDGNCVACHMPEVGAQSPLASRNSIMMPTNLACNWCHLWWPNNTDYIDQGTDGGYDTSTVSGKVMIYMVNWDPENDPRTHATTSTLTSHAISTNNTQPINDYGACFACHGATGSDNGPTNDPGKADMIRPFHGLGDPVTSSVAVTFAAGSNTDHTRHINNFFAGPQHTTTSESLKTDPYHPGYAAINYLAEYLRNDAAPGNKMYNTDDKNFKFIHQTEQQVLWSCRNTAIIDQTTETASAQYNNWGSDLGSVGSITILSGALEGSATIDTVIPLVDLSLPTSIGPQTCP